MQEGARVCSYLSAPYIPTVLQMVARYIKGAEGEVAMPSYALWRPDCTHYAEIMPTEKEGSHELRHCSSSNVHVLPLHKNNPRNLHQKSLR